MQMLITIKAKDPAHPAVQKAAQTLNLIAGDMIGVSLHQQEEEEGNPYLGDVITWAIVLSPIIKVGMEFLLKQLFKVIMKKAGKEEENNARYVFNIYLQPGDKPIITSQVEKADELVTAEAKKWRATHPGVQPALYTLLGEGQTRATLITLLALDYDKPGTDPEKIRSTASSLLEKLNARASAGEAADQAFEAELNREVYNCIQLLPPAVF